MDLTGVQLMRVEKISGTLFLALARLTELAPEIREAVVLRTIEKLKANGNTMSSEAIEHLYKDFRDGGLFVPEKETD